MSIIDIECEAGEGSALANILRRYIVGNCETWRPIGFAFKGSTIANSAIIANNIIQSNLKFQADILGLEFDITNPSVDANLHIEEYGFTDTFTSKNFNSGSVMCKNSDDIQLLQTTDKESVYFTVYYRKSSGIHSSEDNYDFLRDKLSIQDRVDFPVMASVHYIERRHVTYTVDSYDTKDVIHMTLTGCENPKQVIDDAKSAVITSLMNLSIKNDN